MIQSHKETISYFSHPSMQGHTTTVSDRRFEIKERGFFIQQAIALWKSLPQDAMKAKERI